MNILSFPLVLCLYITLASRRTAYAKECYDIGVADSNVIPNSNFQSSQPYSHYYLAHYGRLRSSEEGWAPTLWDMSSRRAFLQVDLGAVYELCSIMTQGNGRGLREWTKTYKVQTAIHPTGPWVYYQEIDGTDKVFDGNTDSSSVVTQYFNRPVSARFVKFWPRRWNSYPTTRLAIYKSDCTDLLPDCKRLASQGNCVNLETYGMMMARCCRSCKAMEECHDVGVADRNVISDSQFQSSRPYSDRHLAHYGRLNSTEEGWKPTNEDMLRGTAYLQVDLGAVYTLCSIETQGNGKGLREWTVKYKVETAYDRVGPWFFYQETQGTVKEFTGNTDSSSVVTQRFNRPVSARFVRFYPIIWNSYPTTRLAIYKKDCTDSDPECQSLALQGNCSDSRTYGNMMTKCCRWCKFLKELAQDNAKSCVDREASCETQSYGGQCWINAGHMLGKCCATCKRKGLQATY